MSGALLLITLGPVQEFIAQSRRTRDLWYGSHLLSELGRAAARSLSDGGARLIFPALVPGDTELERCLSPFRPDERQPLNIANKLLAEIPAGVDPRELARSTREQVMRFWSEDVAAPVKKRCAGLLASGIDQVWREQIATLLEFTAAWAPLGEYPNAREVVEQAVAARKNLRDFAPWRHCRGNVRKSSLDGARETVLLPPPRRPRKLACKYRIGDTEQLDAVGLVKRAGGNPGQFVPLVNVALASWIELAEKEAAEPLEALRVACEKVGLARVDRDLPCVSSFPFDASVLLPSRWEPVFKEQGLAGSPQPWGRQHVKPLLKRLSEPYPYVACLVADGDRMGRAIDVLASAGEHRSLSSHLARFAGDAREIIEQDHRGSLVYAGGDDVLAFLPVPEALACADKLQRGFAELMADAITWPLAAGRPTLSVGVGIGHVMEGMGDLLALGREAKALAKAGVPHEQGHERNALAVVLDKRSGGPRCWRVGWDDWGGDPVGRLRSDAVLLEKGLSVRKVYEVARTLSCLPEPDVSNDPAWAGVL
ncbi:MAG: type III-B CRISPR-associated protein Cas10/Cmr2, partial [Acidobacteriota bacterium]